MTAEVTTTLKTNVLKLLQTDLDSDGNNYYISLGRAAIWNVNDTPPVSVDSDASSFNWQQKARHRMSLLKVVQDNSMIIPRNLYDLSGNTKYYGYDDIYDIQSDPHIVINQYREVFVCVQSAKDVNGVVENSFVEPTLTLQSAIHGSDAHLSFKTSDKYIWRFLYKLSPAAANNFLSKEWIPIKTVQSNPAPTLTEEIQQLSVQNSSASTYTGEIINCQIIEGGSGYTTPTLSVVGNGSGASFTLNVSNGVIVSAQLDSDNSGVISHGSGYDYASAIITDGGGTPTSNASVRFVLGNGKGLATDPEVSMRTRDIMVRTDFEDDEQGTLLTSNDFRQEVLIKNPRDKNGLKLTANTANAIDAINVTGSPQGGTIEEDLDIVVGATTIGKVYYYDASNNKVYYWADETSGFVGFTNASGADTLQIGPGGNVQISTTNPSINCVDRATVDRYTGDIFYINNREGVERQSNQTEDVRLIIRF